MDKEKNVYKDNLDDCGHQNMLTDPDLFNYIYDEIKFENIYDLNKTIIKAINEYKTDRDYVSECNHRLVVLSSPKLKLQCDNYAITEENFVKNKIMKPKKDLDVALFMLVELQIWEIHLMNIFVII